MVQSPVLLIRADSSECMGTGHVMRCLALAQAWQDAGRRVVFALASCSAGIAERLRAENIDVVHLACAPASSQDALATVDTAISAGSDWIVLDGYHFDATYQAAISRSGWKLLAIDDFGALENYTADIIVNQDTFADERLYAHRAAHTRLLLGTDYTFLRREFRRQPRPERKATAVARRLLLTFGGSDPGRLTEMALVALECVTIDGLEAVILVGPSNPRWEQLQAATASRSNIRLLRNPPDIPQWMAWCDMAVTAAGGTLWELAYCRVPSIVVLTSEEQAPATDILQRREVCQSLGLGNRRSPGQLAAAIASLCGDPQRRSALAANLGAMVDGQGADRVLAAMQAAGADR